MKFNIKKLYSDIMSKYSIYFVLFIMIIVCSFLNSNFLTFSNLSNISSQLAVTTILACGATMLIISGMIDLSCGSVLALAGVLSVSSYKTTNNMILSLLIAIMVGVICNLINAIMITKFKVPPFIATLAMLTMARGAALKLYRRTKYISNRKLHDFRTRNFARGNTDSGFIFNIIRYYNLVYSYSQEIR